MPTKRERELLGKDLSFIADVMSEAGPDSAIDQMCRSEFLLRQTELLQKSAEASERAAQAALNTAEYTQKYTRYMLWSVLILLFSVLISLGVGIAQVVQIVDHSSPPKTDNSKSSRNLQ